MDDLDQLKSALDRATPQPDPAAKAAHLALAMQNFERMKPAEISWFERLRARMTLRSGGAVAGSLTVCIGALLLVLPQTPDAPEMPQSPALLQTADDLFAESSMADAAEITGMAPLGRTMAGAVPVDAPLTGQLDMLFNSRSVMSIQAPWSSDTWLVFVSTSPSGNTGISFDETVLAKPVNLGGASGLSAQISSNLLVFEVNTAGVDLISEPIGDVLFEGDDSQPIQLDRPGQDMELVQFAAAVIGFSQATQGQTELGDWGMTDAITFAAEHLGTDPSGQRTAILAQMRAIAGQ